MMDLLLRISASQNASIDPQEKNADRANKHDAHQPCLR